MSWLDRLTAPEKVGLLVVGLVVTLLIAGSAIFFGSRRPTASPALTPTARAVLGAVTPTVPIAATATSTPPAPTAIPTVFRGELAAVTSTPVPPATETPAAPVATEIPPTVVAAVPVQPTRPPPAIVVAPPPQTGAPPGQAVPGQPPVGAVSPPVQVDVQNASSHADARGVTHIVGEVLNRSAVPARPVTVTATLYDRANNVIGTANAFPAPLPIPPGGRAAFDLEIPTPPPGLDHFGLGSVAGASAEPIRTAGLQAVNPTSAVDPATGTVRVVGQVHNAASELRRGVYVVVLFYDPAGKVVRVGAAQANPADLPPGGLAPFEVAVVASGLQLQRFDLIFGVR